MAHTQIVAAVEHAAERVSAAVNQVAVAFRRRDVHDRSVEMLRDKRFRRFRTEVAEEHDEGVAAVRLRFVDSLQHVLFVFDG